MKTFLFPSLLILSLASRVGCETITIHEASDFLRISENVKNGITYEGTTVLLDNDVDFSGYSEGYHSIGIILDHTFVYLPFCGEFDGQGHVVRNFVLNSTERLSGLFGLINGTSFKNLVMDSSCSITDGHNFSSNITSYSGGLIAYVYPTSTEQQGIIDGCVNMANIKFIGDSTNAGRGTTLVGTGGIVGYIIPDVSEIEMRNCVNYGSISFTGTSDIASIGGILGAYFLDSFTSSTESIIKNCVNFGNVTENGSISYMLIIGGITGVSINGLIENCINYGTSYHAKESEAIGKIVGGVNTKVTISNCFWTNELDFNEPSGYNMGNPTILNTYLVESNVTIMNELNSWTDANNNGDNKYSKWMMLHLNGGNIQKIYEDTPITLRKQVIDPTKEGHNFTHWCTDSDCLSGEFSGELENITDLYAMWEINIYTLTFDFGNGTVISSSCKFNSTITYPDTPKVNGFREWNSSLERMPAHDLVIGPNTTHTGKSSFSTGAIAGCIIGGVIILALIILAVLFFVLEKTKDDSEARTVLLETLFFKKGSNLGRTRGRSSRSGILGRTSRTGMSGSIRGSSNGIRRRTEENYIANERNTEMDPNMTSSVSTQYTNTAHLELLYPRDYCPPILMDALLEAGLSRKMAKLIIDTCSTAVDETVSEEDSIDDFTIDDAIAISMYTFDFGSKKEMYNPYKIINKALMGEGNIKEVKGLLYLLMRALRKLPHSKGRLLYRGVKEPVREDIYISGNVVTWPSLASTSPDMKAVKKFLTEDVDEDDQDDNPSEGDTKKGTLFIIENGWGYNIQPYSLFPEEEEILLEPKRQFQVESVIESETTIIKMTMLDTPLLFSQIASNNDD